MPSSLHLVVGQVTAALSDPPRFIFLTMELIFRVMLLCVFVLGLVHLGLRHWLDFC